MRDVAQMKIVSKWISAETMAHTIEEMTHIVQFIAASVFPLDTEG
jgi:hypothetical protein